MCKNNCNCISDILKVIFLLQKNADREDDCIESCDRPTLGQFPCVYFNTRPVMLYTCMSNGTDAWSAPTTRTANPDTYSQVFRVEKINDCCATFRVLISNEDGTYTSTDSFFTMNLECICSIRCLGDTFVENI
jgi:hypothetical protein